ncbi:MAG: hypothetical protein JWO43_109 [Candidatus Adlerbacteria bacterium]|nr:hypothetical protein [Candidatus Adlerbacteria bacterium]
MHIAHRCERLIVRAYRSGEYVRAESSARGGKLVFSTAYEKCKQPLFQLALYVFAKRINPHFIEEDERLDISNLKLDDVIAVGHGIVTLAVKNKHACVHKPASVFSTLKVPLPRMNSQWATVDKHRQIYFSEDFTGPDPWVCLQLPTDPDKSTSVI